MTTEVRIRGDEYYRSLTAISATRGAISDLEYAIAATPTGPKREALTTANIVINCALDVLLDRPNAAMPEFAPRNDPPEAPAPAPTPEPC